MMPDTAEGRERIARLEERIRSVEGRVKDLDIDMRAFAPLVGTLAELRGDLRHLQTDVTALRESMEREDEHTFVSKGWRIGAAVALLIAAVGPFVQLVLTGAH
jgi:hypothetical protein